MPFKRLLLRAVAIGRRRDRLRDTTLKQYRADLDRRLDRVLALPRCGEAADRLRRRIARDRGHLFTFVTNHDVPATNNISERTLLPRVIFRKLTNGFRSEWRRTLTPPSALSSAPPKPTAAPCSRTSVRRWQQPHPARSRPNQGEQLHA